MNKTIKILIYIITLLIFTSLGFFVGKNSNNTKIKEYETLKQNIDRFFPQPPQELYSIGGVVKNVSGGEVIIEINSFSKSNYPWDEPSEIKKEQRTVKITKNTKLKKVVIDPFTEPVFSEDRQIKEPENQTFKPSDLKQGDYIQVSSIENIKTNKQITAKEIIFQELKEYSPEEMELQAKKQAEAFPSPAPVLVPESGKIEEK